MTDNTFQINYSQILKDKNTLDITKNLARSLQKNPYLTVGDFLSTISDSDLRMLLNGTDDVNEKDNLMCDLVLITLMLSAAEGLDAQASDEKMTRNVNVFVNFLAIESLARHGLVKAYRQNMSFGDDCSDRIIVERINDGER